MSYTNKNTMQLNKKHTMCDVVCDVVRMCCVRVLTCVSFFFFLNRVESGWVGIKPDPDPKFVRALKFWP